MIQYVRPSAVRTVSLKSEFEEGLTFELLSQVVCQSLLYGANF